MRRPLRPLVAVFAAVVALTGCIKFDTELTIATDDTVDGAVVVAFSKRFLDIPGIGELFEGLTEVAPDEQPSRGRVTTRPYEDDDFRGVELVLDDVPIDEIGGAVGAGSGTGPTDTDLRIVREGDRFRFTGVLDLRGDTGGDVPDVPGVDDLLGSAEVRVEVTFPGDVIEANGDVDGRRVRWTPAIGELVEMEALGSAVPGGDSRFPWLAVLAGGLGLVVLGAGAVALARRSGRSSPPPPPPELTAPPGPPPPLPTPSLPTPMRGGRPMPAPDEAGAPPGSALPPPPSGQAGAPMPPPG